MNKEKTLKETYEAARKKCEEALENLAEHYRNKMFTCKFCKKKTKRRDVSLIKYTHIEPACGWGEDHYDGGTYIICSKCNKQTPYNSDPGYKETIYKDVYK
jgi:hypothetical protein